MRHREQAPKQRGILEKVPGSGIWLVRHVDATGRLRREKASTKSAAQDLTVRQHYVHPTPQAMEDAVAKLDNMNARSLESTLIDSCRRDRSGSIDQRVEVLAKMTDTRTDNRARPAVPQVLEGRVAQLAEQLTLNQ
jgi:hypothetical protein